MAIGLGLWSKQRVGSGVCVLVAMIVLTSLFGFADTGAKPVMSVKAKRGAAIFQQNCLGCHNKQPNDTAPFGPPNLHGIFGSKPLVSPPITPLQAEDVIKKGVAPMPAFGDVLTEAQINDLIAYLKAQ